MLREHIPFLAVLAGIVAIGASDTVAGLILRISILAPLVWTGAIDVETATQFATLYR